MSLKNNIDKIIQREAEIEQMLINSSNLKPSEVVELSKELSDIKPCLLYTSPSPRDATLARMPSSA